MFEYAKFTPPATVATCAAIPGLSILLYYSLMGRVAFGVLEEQQDGSWICRRATTVEGRYGPIPIAQNQVFHTRSVFGGYEDFVSHLAAVSVETPSIAPHEW